MIKIKELHYPINNLKTPEQQVVVMGFFDGVHLGHQKVIKRAKEIATKLNLPLAVLTYDPHPSVVFQTFSESLKYLTTTQKKAELFEDMGVTQMYKMQFTSKLASLEPQNFVDEVLMKLNPRVVVAGFDHLYGGDASKANMRMLATYANNRFDVEIVDKLTDDNQKVGSSVIKKALSVGNMVRVNRQLGRIYMTTGIVVHGEARGRELGFPTANILTPELEMLPGIGIYAVKIKINEQWYTGMASIGRNVTFGDNRPVTVEINILDFNQQIYGENVKVAWYHHLRNEVKFSTVEMLIQQLQQDEKNTREYFEM